MQHKKKVEMLKKFNVCFIKILLGYKSISQSYINFLNAADDTFSAIFNMSYYPFTIRRRKEVVCRK